MSPPTYPQDLMHHAVLERGLLGSWLDMLVLFLSGILFLEPSIKLHRRSRRLGY